MAFVLDILAALRLVGVCANYMVNVSGTGQHSEDLTPREAGVFALLLDAHCDKEISAMLIITRRTVRFHIGNIFRKFHVSTRAELFVSVFKDNPLVAAAHVRPPLCPIAPLT